MQTTGRHMHITYFALFFCLVVFAGPNPRIEVLPNPQGIEDFDHEFKGCPENSECDQVMGHMMSRWKNLINKLKQSSDPIKKTQMLELFRSKYGIPTEFYTNQKSLQSFGPALHNSPCREHNPRTGEKILRATAFIKSLTNEKALIWRDQSLLEMPLKDNLTPQPVKVYYLSGPITYQLSLGDQPLYIKNKELLVLKEDDGFYFALKVSTSGDWKIVDLDMTQLSKWENKRQDIDCPKDSEKSPPEFNMEFCKTVWDEDLNQLVTVRMNQGCSI